MTVINYLIASVSYLKVFVRVIENDFEQLHRSINPVALRGQLAAN